MWIRVFSDFFFQFWRLGSQNHWQSTVKYMCTFKHVGWKKHKQMVKRIPKESTDAFCVKPFHKQLYLSSYVFYVTQQHLSAPQWSVALKPLYEKRFTLKDSKKCSRRCWEAFKEKSSTESLLNDKNFNKSKPWKRTVFEKIFFGCRHRYMRLPLKMKNNWTTFAKMAER